MNYFWEIVWNGVCLFMAVGVVMHVETHRYNPIEELVFGLLVLFLVACAFVPLLFV